MRISDWSSDVCSSDLALQPGRGDVLPRQADAQADRRRAHDVGAVVEHVHVRQPLPMQARGAEPVGPTLQREVGEQRECQQVAGAGDRSEEHTSELQSLMRISYAVFCLKKKRYNNHNIAQSEHASYETC